MAASVREDASRNSKVIERLAMVRGLQLCFNLGIFTTS